eukprot:1729539-Prymnesium_polylepis.1
MFRTTICLAPTRAAVVAVNAWCVGCRIVKVSKCMRARVSCPINHTMQHAWCEILLPTALQLYTTVGT